MNLTAEQVYQAALALPVDEKLQLVEELLAACELAGELPFDPAWLTEVRRRCQQIDKGEVALSTWAEVKQRAREARGS
jgi:putative addiction module component (TIGR02574 family)